MGLSGSIFILSMVIIILKKLEKIPSFVVGGAFQVSITIFSGLSQFGALLMGMEIEFDTDMQEKDTTYIVFTIVLFMFSFVLSLIGYYIGQIIQNKTNIIIKRTVDVVEKKKKHTAHDSKKMIKDVADLTGVK
jgi:cellulose synthase/poly-beta-1,6-N-acetylglucosamine synthase-like glycosyltransferase